MNNAMKKLVELSVEGAKILELCEEGDKLIEAGTAAVFNSKTAKGKVAKGELLSVAECVVSGLITIHQVLLFLPRCL